MKPHLPLALLKSLKKALVLTFTIGTTGYLWASPSYSSGTLTIDSGYNAAVRMGNNSDATTQQNYNRFDNNRSRITYSQSNSRFTGGSTISNNAQITKINIEGSGSLYLYNSGNTDFRGTINVSNGTTDAPGVIGTYNTTAANLVIGTLTGSGNLLLRGHNTSGTSTFEFTNNSFAGTVYMTANGGNVQLNAAGEHWSGTVVDFTNAASNSLIDSTAEDARGIILNLTNDATFAGLNNGDSNVAQVKGANYMLTVGDNTDNTYKYGGTANLGSLTKIGNSTQGFLENVDIATVTVEQGSLEFKGGLKTTTLNLTGGTLSTEQATVTTANLTGGSTWELGENVSLSKLNLTAGSGAVTLSGKDGKNITIDAPSTITFSGYTVGSDTPIFTLDGTTLDLTGSTLNFEGLDLAGVSTLNFANLSNGGSYTYGDGPITVTAGGSSYEAELTTDGGMLQLAFGKDTEVAAGTKLWVYADSSGKPINGLNAAYYTDDSWSGTTVKANDLRTVQLASGSEIYLRAENTQAIYTGNIELRGGNTPTLLHSENTNATWELKGTLSGSGELRLVGHNTAGATIFTPTGADIDGTISMAGACGGDVQVNLSGNMQNTAVDLSAHTQNSIYTPETEPTSGRAILTVEGDTTLAGISGTDSQANLAATQSGATLTLGTNSADSTYSYAGTVGGNYYTDTDSTAAAGTLNLVKTGSNTQHFEQSATFGSVSHQGGTLSFGGNLTADSLTLQSGTLSTQGSVNLSSATLYGGTTWELGSNWNSSNTDLSLVGLDKAPVTFTGTGATWTLSQAIDVAASGMNNTDSALVSLDGVNLNLGSAFTLSGVQSGLSTGDTIVLANLSNGAGVHSTNGEIALNNGAYKATLSTENNQAVLTITSVRQTVKAGQNMWIHRFENETGKVTGEMEGLLGCDLSDDKKSWTGGESITGQGNLSDIYLEEGANLYVRDGAATSMGIGNPGDIKFDRSNAQYDGNITIVNTDNATPARLHIDTTSWVVYHFNGQLSGSGELQLVNHANATDWNRWDSIFNFDNFDKPDEWFEGTVSLRSPKSGPIQLNIGNPNGGNDTRWDGVVMDLSNNKADLTDVFQGSTALPDGVVLGLVGDATVKGLTGEDDSEANRVSGVSTNITESGKYYTLTLGTDSGENYTYGGTLGYNRFYMGGNLTSSEGGVNALTSASGSLSITKVGSNTQTFTGSATLHEITVQDGTLRFDGNVTASALTLQGGTFINNGTLTGLHTANLDGAATWQMGTSTTTNGVIFNLSGLANDSSITIDGSRGTTWTMGGDIMLANSGTTGSEGTALFTLNNNMGLNIGSFLTIQGVQLPTGSDRIALFDIGNGSYNFGNYEKVAVTTTDGVNYAGHLMYENGIIYVGNLSVDANWPPALDPEKGYIWSGETNGTVLGDYDHRTLVMGNVWRADGSDENTGWHEQAFNGKNPGVYVNGNTVTFADENMHGEAVEEPGRLVNIQGTVAPGTIYVTAERNDGYAGNVKDDAQIKFGYAFTTTANGFGSIADIDAENPTSIIKTGDALLVLNTSNTFSGGIDVQDGGLYLGIARAAGTGTIKLHADKDWTFPAWNSYTDSWVDVKQHGAEMMVCYTHSDDFLSSFRNPILTNRIELIDTDGDATNNQITISFARSTFNHLGSNDHANVPRHWRNLTLSGAIVGTAPTDTTLPNNRQDTLILKSYSSTWDGFKDQSYVTTFSLFDADSSTPTTFSGTVKTLNTVNDSQLEMDMTKERSGGTVQVMLRDSKLQYAELDLTRDWQKEAPNNDTNRQSYTNILVSHGNVALRGLSADFLGTGWVYDQSASADEGEHVYKNLTQADERWRVRTVANAETTLQLGQHETENVNYIYSGAIGFAQSYVEPGQGHVRYDDGFGASTSSNNYESRFGGHSMGQEGMFSLIKLGAANQYIHTAQMNDVSVASGLLGFNSLELRGNLNLVSGSRLSLGVTDNTTYRTIGDLPTVDKVGWGTITNTKYNTSDTVTINGNKTLTVYTQAPAEGVTVPTTAVADGNIAMQSNSALTFVVNQVEPWWQEYQANDFSAINNHERPSENMLLTVNGNLELMEDTTKLNINFSGVNFTLTPYSDRMYYLAEADNITVGNGGDSSDFAERLISLGYGYFGMVDTLDSSSTQYSTGGKDYLIMTVMGDPRNTWSGMVSRTDGDFTWSHTDRDKAPAYDYHWKENTAFSNGNVVLFGNLYTPDEWEATEHLTGEQTVRVQTTDGSLQPGTPVAATDSDFTVNGFNETARFGKEYQRVNISGEVAPLSVIVNSEYVDVTNGNAVTSDGTNYYFYGSGTIRDATEGELSTMFQQYQNGFDGDSWNTNLEKYGSGTLVIATNNSYSGGTLLQGGRLVMQHENALGTGLVTITNGATLQGDFADTVPTEYDLMQTTTIHNTVYVNTFFDPDATTNTAPADAFITNAYDKKLVLTKLAGESDTVVVLRGTSLSEEQAADYGGKYTYAVFKVLDPGEFSGTLRMDGNIWQQREYKYPSPEGQPFGGNVQLDIMSTAKANAGEDEHKDWLNVTIDLSVTKDFGTNRTVLALDPIEVGEQAEARQYAQVNNLVGGGNNGGPINSSVVNMSHNRAVTLEIMGLRDGDYDGALGYGDFQVTVDYTGSHAELGGQAHHHLGGEGIGNLNVLKKGTSTTQSVYDAWLTELKVEAGSFTVDRALVAQDIYAGINPDIESSSAGARVIVGTPENTETMYALTVGNGGILAMYSPDGVTADGEAGADAWANVHSGIDNNEDGLAGWVNLENGATVTARSDWQALSTVENGRDGKTSAKTLDIDMGATVTFNTHNYSPDEWVSNATLAQLRENLENAGNDTARQDLTNYIAVVEKLNYSHIMQFDGKLTGNNVHLIFNNEQMSAGATEKEMGTAEYMGYVAIQDHNTMTGDLLVKDKTVLQVLHSNSAESAMNATIDGPDAAMQTIHGKTQYVNNLTVQKGGSLLLGGSEKLSLGTGENRLKNVDMTDVQMSVSNREGYVGTMSTVHTDTSSQNSYYLGGTSALRSEAEAVHITVHDSTATVNNYVHDINLHNSLVELESSCTVDMGDSVLVDKDSIVYGQGVTHFNDDLYSLSKAVGSIEDFELIAPKSMDETAYVSKNTTVEMTFAGDRATYTGTTAQGNSATVYTIKADQFQGTNVDNLAGSGLTIKLQQDILGEAWRAGADVVAIQIGGNESGNFTEVNGQFMFENGSGEFEMSDAERLMLDIHGHDITANWIDSATLFAQFGIQGSQHMLYIIVPEPATATLSLLALAALAARRRRK